MAKLTSSQQKVVMHDSGNILISASAGSGKTHTMIERVIRLILQKKADVEEILAVTFTEKAAADMKEKLKKALIKAYKETGDESLVASLNKIPTCDISTIHSFCARLIRAYFFVVGVSPDFKIADEADANIIRNECLEKTFREFYLTEEKWFYDLVDKHAVSRTDKGLKELIESAYEFIGNELDSFALINKYKTYFTVKGLELFNTEYKKAIDKKIKAHYTNVINAKRFFEEAGLGKSLKFTKTLLLDMDKVLNCFDVYKIRELKGYSLRSSFENKLEGEAVFHKQKAVSARDVLKKLISSVCDNLTDKEKETERVQQYYEHIEGFSRVLKQFSDYYSETKREENVLDFSDLEHFALSILRDENVLKEIQKKYKFIFIDEYQDVNSVQEEIMTLLSSNNLLMVGDLKQGIYAFRGCRSEIFAGKLTSMPERGEEVVRLNENFRSSRAVVNLVNEIFNFCMTDLYFEENYKGNAELVFGGLFPDGYEGRAEFHFYEKTEQSTKEQEPCVYDVLQEAKKEDETLKGSVVSLLTEIINEELRKTVYDVKLEKERKVQLKDIAILTRAKKSEYVTEIVKGLIAHGIPVVSDAKENVCDFPEIAMLVNAVRLMDCFQQDIPLASTLKSPIGNFVDEDLFDIVNFYQENGNRGSFYQAYVYYLENAEGELKERLSAFNEYFNRIRFVADFVGAFGALQTIVKDKELESYLLAETAGKTKVLRLKRFLSASLYGGKRLTVKEFLNKIESSADSFGLTECGEEDAVKVMTMHASKGLEFPVVIACGLERKFDSQDDIREILFSRKYGFVPRYYDEEKRTKEKTIFRGVVTLEQAEERIKEEMRLFYVALTRATYSLHMVAVGSKDSRSDEFLTANKFTDFIPSYIPVTVHKSQDFNFTELKKGRRKVLIGQTNDKKVKELKERFDWRYPFSEDTNLPLKYSVTAAVKNSLDEKQDFIVLFPEENTDTERGQIAHKIMEYYDFGSNSPLREQVDRLIEAKVLTEKEVFKVNLERIETAILNSNLNRYKDSKLFREKEFLVSIPAKEIFTDSSSEEAVLLQGIIDLLSIKDNEASIVDYKYSHLNKSGLVVSYKKQLDLYAYAVKKVLGIKVVEKKIVNIFTGECVEVQ